MHLEHPYRFDGHGRTATATDERYLRGLIEQVLLTQPGERVNRPDFGSGIRQLAFSPLSDELASATQFLVRGALEQWLGHLIVVDDVTVTGDDGVLTVRIGFVVQRTGERRVEEFEGVAG